MGNHSLWLPLHKKTESEICGVLKLVKKKEAKSSSICLKAGHPWCSQPIFSLDYTMCRIA
jgi:hypothetical protein